MDQFLKVLFFILVSVNGIHDTSYSLHPIISVLFINTRSLEMCNYHTILQQFFHLQIFLIDL